MKIIYFMIKNNSNLCLRLNSFWNVNGKSVASLFSDKHNQHVNFGTLARLPMYSSETSVSVQIFYLVGDCKVWHLTTKEYRLRFVFLLQKQISLSLLWERVKHIASIQLHFLFRIRTSLNGFLDLRFYLKRTTFNFRKFLFYFYCMPPKRQSQAIKWNFWKVITIFNWTTFNVQLKMATTPYYWAKICCGSIWILILFWISHDIIHDVVFKWVICVWWTKKALNLSLY